MSESHPSPERPHLLEHEGRIARLEGIVEQIDVRLGRIETKVDDNREALEAQNRRDPGWHWKPKSPPTARRWKTKLTRNLRACCGGSLPYKRRPWGPHRGPKVVRLGRIEIQIAANLDEALRSA